MHIPRRQTEPDTDLKRLLKSAPQDLWLDTIRRTNRNEHQALIFWMLNQTECDFAIATHAFYRSDPCYYLDHPAPLPQPPKHDDIFALVLLNWDKGFFRNHALAVDSQDVSARYLARINQKVMARPRGSLPFFIPSELLKPDGGVPPHIPADLSPDNAPAVWPLYNNAGLKVPAAAPGLQRRIAKVKDVIDKMRFRTKRA